MTAITETGELLSLQSWPVIVLLAIILDSIKIQ